MFRKENGVTLVALVITIIVLLILAGVTISMVLGDDGIIAQASGASEAQVVADVKSAVGLALASMRTEDVAIAAGIEDELSTTENKIGYRVKNLLKDAGYEDTDILIETTPADSATEAKVTITIDNSAAKVASITALIEKNASNNYEATYELKHTDNTTEAID